MARAQYGVAPSAASHLATKAYVDARVPFSGPAFSASRITTDQTVSDATATEIVFNSEDLDTAGAYNPATGRFTPQVAGLYQFNVRMVFTSSATDILNAQILLYKNGAQYRSLTTYLAPAASTVVCSGSCAVYLNGSTDYVSAWGYLDTTSGTRKIAITSVFEGFYVGEGNVQTAAMGEVNYTASTTYTISASSPDVIRMNNASANSVKLPTLANAAGLLLRKPYLIQQLGAGATTISADTGATRQLRSGLTGVITGQYGAATAMLVDATTWWVFGDLT